MELAVTDREYGELSERVRGIQVDVSLLKTDMATNTKATNEILKQIASVTGGWRMLIAAAAIVSALVTFLLKFLPIGFHL